MSKNARHAEERYLAQKTATPVGQKQIKMNKEEAIQIAIKQGDAELVALLRAYPYDDVHDLLIKFYAKRSARRAADTETFCRVIKQEQSALGEKMQARIEAAEAAIHDEEARQRKAQYEVYYKKVGVISGRMNHGPGDIEVTADGDIKPYRFKNCLVSDLDTATGKELDDVGKYVYGIERANPDMPDDSYRYTIQASCDALVPIEVGQKRKGFGYDRPVWTAVTTKATLILCENATGARQWFPLDTFRKWCLVE